MSILNLTVFDKLSEEEIRKEIGDLERGGYLFEPSKNVGPVLIYGGNRVIFTSKPESPRIVMNHLVAEKYNASYISLPAQEIIDFFEKPEKDNLVMQLKTVGIHLNITDLENTLELICLGVSLDKKIFEEPIEEQYSDSIRPIPSITRMTNLRRCPKGRPAIFDESVTDSQLDDILKSQGKYSP